MKKIIVAVLALLPMAARADVLVLPCAQARELLPQIETRSNPGVELAVPSSGDCRITYVLKAGQSLPAFVDRRARRIAMTAEAKDIMARFDAGTDTAADRRRLAYLVTRYILDQENE